MTALAKVYVASKTDLAEDWRVRREVWGDMGLAVTSTWIDEAGPGESDMSVLWPRIVDEVYASDFLLALHRPGDVWKGAYAEVGMALAFRRPVYFVGLPQGTLHHHPGVTIASDPDDAVEDFRARRLKREWY